MTNFPADAYKKANQITSAVYLLFAVKGALRYMGQGEERVQPRFALKQQVKTISEELDKLIESLGNN